MTAPETSRPVDLNTLFLEARTHNGWQDKPVPDDLLRRLYDVLRMPPTAANSQPARFVFVKSAAAKERLLAGVSPGNLEKTKAAPVTVIVAYDREFYEKMPTLFPAYDMRSNYLAMPEAKRDHAAFQSGTLQGAYLILAARALGLDCGPMAGFDNAKVDAAFFADGKWRSNFLVNLGYGDPSKVFPRNPRLSFEEACRIE